MWLASVDVADPGEESDFADTRALVLLLKEFDPVLGLLEFT